MNLRDCSKNCVASVAGKCAVADCCGPITRIVDDDDQDIHSAASLYDAYIDDFAVYFGEANHDPAI